MTQRSFKTAVAASAYDDMPLSQVLVRYFWPFWLFRDASSGDRYERAAAYRHNRDMRVHLPGYLMKWMVGSATSLAIAAGFASVSTATAGALDVFALIAAGWGVAFACCVSVLLVTTYIYLYLSRHER